MRPGGEAQRSPEGEAELDEDAVLCPACGGGCSRIGVGLWVCEGCLRDWNPRELGERLEEGRAEQG